MLSEHAPVKPSPTGNTVIDACLRNLPIAQRKSKIMSDLQLETNAYALATVHRAENVDDPKTLSNFIETANNPPPAGGGLFRTKTTGEPQRAGR